MEDTERFSGGADLRRAARAFRDNPRDMPAGALRPDAPARDIQDAGALRRLRRDLTAIRQAPAAPDSEIREHPVAAFANPWADMTYRAERPAFQDALVRLQLLFLLAAALLAAVAIVTLLGSVGPALVTSLDIGPGLSDFPWAK